MGKKYFSYFLKYVIINYTKYHTKSYLSKLQFVLVCSVDFETVFMSVAVFEL